ncbi:MAG: endo-1,4-beta-xylanase [Blastocatellia bacterium]
MRSSKQNVRSIISAFVTVITFAAAVSVASAQSVPLRVAAERRGFYIGAAVAMQPFRNDAQYQETLKREFNMLVAENAFKWTGLRPAKDKYYFADADALVAFAEANHMKVRGHTLVWHKQLPRWITASSFTRDEAINLLRDHINTVVGRYKGKIVAWDVVNEAIDDKSGDLRTDSFWYQKIGPDYIRMAFEFARAADPAAKLYYNDYEAEDLSKKSDGVYRLLKELKAARVPVDGIGWQMHVENGFRITDANRTNAARLQALGLEMMITELDVRAKLPMSDQDRATQATTYADILAFCLSQPNCKAVLTWGFTDKYSWIPGWYPGLGDSLLFDASYRPKPAYRALQQAMQPAPRSHQSRPKRQR